MSLSRRKKRTVRVRACALAARKVSDNDDDENQQKKAADPVLTLKLNVEIKPGMYIFNTLFKAFIGLGNQDQSRTLMLANTPVVPAEELQALY